MQMNHGIVKYFLPNFSAVQIFYLKSGCSPRKEAVHWKYEISYSFQAALITKFLPSAPQISAASCSCMPENSMQANVNVLKSISKTF